jgi:Tol biopolymer transport system component
MKSAVALAAAGLALALGVSASQASAPRPIVFAADRAPTVAGEIYRVDPNGRRVNLSKSPYEDGQAAVSSDGKRVAFVRYRGAFAQVFEVGVNGRRLVAAAPRQIWYPSDPSWQPGGKRVAVEAYRGVALDEPGHEPIHIHEASFALGDDPDSPSSWSLDGKVLLLWHGQQHVLEAVSPDGRTLWTHRATYSDGGGWLGGGWSAAGLVAVTVGRGVAVYDESGRLRFRYLLPWTPSTLVWSPDGSSLAASWQINSTDKLQVRTASGAVLLQRHVPGSDSVGWAGNSTVVVDSERADHPSIGVDVLTGKVTSASTRWLDTLSPDRKLALIWRGDTLGVAPTAGGPLEVYRHLPRCNGSEEIPSGHFAGRSIVYSSFCDPNDHLYSIGRRIHRLTNDSAQETQPALSPDGTKIAYVWDGHSNQIRIASAASGATIRTLTHQDGFPTSDGSPSWSPDGQTIVYAEGTFRIGVELFTIPAAGGTPTDLGIAGSGPAWGPSKIAYEGRGIWTANPDGSNPTKVSSTGHDPAWSATGTLAYLFGDSTVVVGSTHIRLPFSDVESLAWSPDASRFVVVASKKNGLEDVYTVKTDGTDPLRLTKYYDASSATS